MRDSPRKRLCDLCNFKGGSAFPKRYQGGREGDYPFIKVSDMNTPENAIRIRTAENWVSSETQRRLKATIHPPDATVFAKIGIAIQSNRRRLLTIPTLIDNNMMSAIPKANTVDPNFLFYLLCTLDFNPISTGTSLPFLRIQELNQIEAPVPELAVQRKIGTILSAYDDLIENNLRRIKILEEMAQLLYRGWFVNFRYPEHEKTRLVGSPLGTVPAGWPVRPLAELTETQYGYTETSRDDPVGPRYLRGMDINKNSYIDWSVVPYCPVGSDDLPKYKLNIGDIVVIRMADPGKVGIVEADVDAVFASYLVRVKIKSESLTPYYLFHFLLSERYQSYISGASTGTTRKSASSGVITGIDIVVPPRPLLKEFEERCGLIRKQLSLLLEKNAILRQARDLLLPKLISGQLDVSDLDIYVAEDLG